MYPIPEQNIYTELLEIAEIDPLNDATRSFEEVIKLAARFINWTDNVSLAPVHVDYELTPIGTGYFKKKFETEWPVIADGVIAKFKAKRNHDTHHTEGHEADDHDTHGHGASRNLLLPHFSISKTFVPPIYNSEEYRRLWPISSLGTGLHLGTMNQVWLIGETFDNNGVLSPGLFHNNNGIVNMGATTIRRLVEIDPEGNSNLQVPEPLSTLRILRAVSRYATKNSLDHTVF
jgi:hypothetical protein